MKQILLLAAFLASFAFTTICAFKAGVCRGKAEAYRDASEKLRQMRQTLRRDEQGQRVQGQRVQRL